MIKNSNKMYKVLGIFIAVAGSSCLPLAAMMPVELFNQTNVPVTCTITQSGSSTALYTFTNIQPGANAPAFSLPVNVNYIITASSSLYVGSLTFSGHANQYATILVNNLSYNATGPMTMYYSLTKQFSSNLPSLN